MINNKKRKNYFISYGDKNKFSKILKKYKNNNIANDTLKNIKHFIPDSINLY